MPKPNAVTRATIGPTASNCASVWSSTAKAFPWAGNARDAATLWPMIEALEARFGRSSRILCFDRGIATEANLRLLRQSRRPYLCATRRAVVRQHLPAIRNGVWTVVRTTPAQEPTIEVQELPSQCHGDVTERWLLCRSAGCRLKEQQIYRKRLEQARQRLARLQAQVVAGTFKTKTVILTKAKKAVGRTHDLQGIFSFALRRTPTGQELQVQE